MVALDIVHASNARLRELGPGLVALFVGATSGIGEATAKAFVNHADSPHVYIVGRSATAANRIIKECQALNKDGKVEFLQADVSELGEVDRVCKEIVEKEKHINLLVQSQGNLNLRGRDESPEGLDRKFTLNYYSRMRFVSNLLPLLRSATTTAPHFSRTLSVLSGGTEMANSFNTKDIELKNSFSGYRCAAHSILMNSFMMEELATRESGISFIHSYPSMVYTGAARELPFWARALFKGLSPLLRVFAVPIDETGERQLYMATSAFYPPAKPSGNVPVAAGIPLPEGRDIGRGTNDVMGSGAYTVNWNDDIAKNKKVLAGYREQGIGKIVWDHTMGVLERVTKINQERGHAA